MATAWTLTKGGRTMAEYMERTHDESEMGSALRAILKGESPICTSETKLSLVLFGYVEREQHHCTHERISKTRGRVTCSCGWVSEYSYKHASYVTQQHMDNNRA